MCITTGRHLPFKYLLPCTPPWNNTTIGHLSAFVISTETASINLRFAFTIFLKALSTFQVKQHQLGVTYLLPPYFHQRK